MYEVALNGMSPESLTYDHVWCVYGRGRYFYGLTRDAAELLCGKLNGALSIG